MLSTGMLLDVVVNFTQKKPFIKCVRLEDDAFTSHIVPMLLLVVYFDEKNEKITTVELGTIGYSPFFKQELKHKF